MIIVLSQDVFGSHKLQFRYSSANIIESTPHVAPTHRAIDSRSLDLLLLDLKSRDRANVSVDAHPLAHVECALVLAHEYHVCSKAWAFNQYSVEGIATGEFSVCGKRCVDNEFTYHGASPPVGSIVGFYGGPEDCQVFGVRLLLQRVRNFSVAAACGSGISYLFAISRRPIAVITQASASDV